MVRQSVTVPQDRPPSLLSRLVLGTCLALFRWKGWRLEGRAPHVPRAVLIGAPHTTNWDFIFFLGATHHFGLRPRFMGKNSLFRWPLTRFMHDMGGVPVDRSRSGNYVDAMIAEFARHEQFHLVIAPEGTRSASRGWRSGFYHIAHGAGVPVVCGWVDNTRMVGGLSDPIPTTGDYAADMETILGFYRSVLPDHSRFRAGGTLD